MAGRMCWTGHQLCLKFRAQQLSKPTESYWETVLKVAVTLGCTKTHALEYGFGKNGLWVDADFAGHRIERKSMSSLHTIVWSNDELDVPKTIRSIAVDGRSRVHCGGPGNEGAAVDDGTAKRARTTCQHRIPSMVRQPERYSNRQEALDSPEDQAHRCPVSLLEREGRVWDH